MPLQPPVHYLTLQKGWSELAFVKTNMMLFIKYNQKHKMTSKTSHAIFLELYTLMANTWPPPLKKLPTCADILTKTLK